VYEHLSRLHEAAPDRVGVYGLVSAAGGPGVRPAAIYVHSKVMIVDDEVAVVGSANMDNISLFRASELLLVCDHAAFARDLRTRLCREHLGALYRPTMDTDFAGLARAFRSVRGRPA
jgi:phosphatidylserine/phosphatidylglycerophosphate/cardiolipin synthase-like enzyme